MHVVCERLAECWDVVVFMDKDCLFVFFLEKCWFK